MQGGTCIASLGAGGKQLESAGLRIRPGAGTPARRAGPDTSSSAKFSTIWRAGPGERGAEPCSGSDQGNVTSEPDGRVTRGC